MTIVLTFFLNSVLSFATGLAVSAALGPTEFGRFAIASTIAIVVSTTMFDWLRLSATRRYNETSRETHPALRASLDVAYLAGGLVIIAGAAAVLASTYTPWPPALPAALVVAVAAASFANGQFDYWTALARALFRDRLYTRVVVLKNVLAFASMVGISYVLRDSAATLAALTISTIVAIAVVWPSLHDRKAHPALADRKLVASFARYGLPVVVGNVLFQIVLLLNRWVLGARLGYADAGQLSLATDVCFRLFLSVGAGFDALLFQKAVRLESAQGVEAAKSQIAQNMVVVVAILAPMAAGYAAVLPLFEQLIVPAAYQGAFAQIGLALAPGVFAFCVMQFAFGPVFQLNDRTGLFVLAAAAGMLCDIVLLVLLAADAGPVAVAAVHSASLCVSTLVAGFYALRVPGCAPPLRELLPIPVATGVMMLAVWPMRSLQPAWFAFAGAVAVGAVVYAIFTIIFNIAGLRANVRAQTRRLRKFGDGRSEVAP